MKVSFFLFLVLIASFLFGEPSIYNVKNTENLNSISIKTGVPVNVLQKANPVVDDFSQSQQIYIPEKYKVQSGQTLYSLAKLWNVTQQAIMDWNGLQKAQDLKSGMWIYIPFQNIKKTDEFFWPVKGTPSRSGDSLNSVKFIPQKGNFFSVCDGTVIFKGVYQGLGAVILVESEEKVTFAFGNFESSVVEFGRSVKKGQQLGHLSDRTGLTFFAYKEGKSLDTFTVRR